MKAKLVTAYGRPVIIVCDGECDKAWGMTTRPKIELSDDPDDVEWLSDSELETAPDDPGTYEGGHAKPTASSYGYLNKWCFRACERSTFFEVEHEKLVEFEMRDWSKRLRNKVR